MRECEQVQVFVCVCVVKVLATVLEEEKKE